MALQDELDKVIRIEVEPPSQANDLMADNKVIIDLASVIEEILATLQFQPSTREAIQSCKAPPGFTIRFVTEERSYVADITAAEHKHLVVWGGKNGETIHYELPPDFEERIQPYLWNSLRLHE